MVISQDDLKKLTAVALKVVSGTDGLLYFGGKVVGPKTDFSNDFSGEMRGISNLDLAWFLIKLETCLYNAYAKHDMKPTSDLLTKIIGRFFPEIDEGLAGEIRKLLAEAEFQGLRKKMLANTVEEAKKFDWSRRPSYSCFTASGEPGISTLQL
jgi:hypothetical protein